MTNSAAGPRRERKIVSKAKAAVDGRRARAGDDAVQPSAEWHARYLVSHQEHQPDIGERVEGQVKAVCQRRHRGKATVLRLEGPGDVAAGPGQQPDPENQGHRTIRSVGDRPRQAQSGGGDLEAVQGPVVHRLPPVAVGMPDERGRDVGGEQGAEHTVAGNDRRPQCTPLDMAFKSLCGHRHHRRGSPLHYLVVGSRRHLP